MSPLLIALALPLCFARESLSDRMLRIAESWDLALIYPASVTEGFEAPHLCSSDYKSAVAFSLKGTAIRAKFYDDPKILVLDHGPRERRLLASGWTCVPVDRVRDGPECGDFE